MLPDFLPFRDLGLSLDRSFQRQHIQYIFFEQAGVGSQIGQRQATQVPPLIDTVPHNPPGHLMRFPKGKRSRHQIVGQFRR